VGGPAYSHFDLAAFVVVNSLDVEINAVVTDYRERRYDLMLIDEITMLVARYLLPEARDCSVPVARRSAACRCNAYPDRAPEGPDNHRFFLTACFGGT
jgi:hypothetical protein